MVSSFIKCSLINKHYHDCDVFNCMLSRVSGTLFSLVFLSLLGQPGAQRFDNDELNTLEQILTIYKKSLMVKKDKVPDNMIDSYAIGSGYLIPESLSTTCASNVRRVYQECLNKNVSSSENIKCSDAYVKEYSKCYFGVTLQHGSKDSSLCDAFCVFNHDQCIINSNKLEIFICMGARDICKSHCPICANDGGDTIENLLGKLSSRKRGCINRQVLCNKRNMKCLDFSTSDSQRYLCKSAGSMCKPTCK